RERNVRRAAAPLAGTRGTFGRFPLLLSATVRTFRRLLRPSRRPRGGFSACYALRGQRWKARRPLAPLEATRRRFHPHFPISAQPSVPYRPRPTSRYQVLRPVRRHSGATCRRGTLSVSVAERSVDVRSGNEAVPEVRMRRGPVGGGGPVAVG